MTSHYLNRGFKLQFGANSGDSWGNDIGSLIYTLLPLIWYIICLCLVKFQKLYFTRPNCQFDICLVLHIGPLKIKNRDHFPTCFDTTNLMAISELPNELRLKCAFSEVIPITLFWVQFWFIYFCFGNRTYHWTHSDERSPILSSNHYFWLMVKFSYFGRFLALGLGFTICSSRAVVSTWEASLRSK